MTKKIQHNVKDTYQLSKTKKATKKGMADGSTIQRQKVKMKGKGACIYRGNGTEDEWMLRFE